jgi:hypothetical protein
MYPPTRERRSGLGRLIWWAFWVLLIVYIFHHPSQAADQSRHLLAGIESAGEAIATFLQHAGGNR